MTQLPHIVCGYVRSPEGEAALDEAIREAQMRQAHLSVLHFRAIPPENPADATGFVEHELLEPGAQSDSSSPPEAGYYEEKLAWLDSVLSSKAISHTVKELPIERSIADDILAVARAEKAELIVIGIRNRSPLGKLLLGSGTQTILLEADCPVLAVRPK